MDFGIQTRLALGALEYALRTSGVPQRLDYFFPEPGAAIIEFKNKEWQRKFLVILGTKGALTIKGELYSVKNRYFLETLVNEARAKKPDAILEMVWMANGGEPGGWRDEINSSVPKRELAPAPTPEQKLQPTVPASTEEAKSQEPADVLQRIEEAIMVSLAIQEKLAENIIYVRDRGDKLHDRFKNLSERLAILEAKLELPAPAEIDTGRLEEKFTSIAESVSSIGTAVSSMKVEVHQVMESTINQTASDRIAQVQASLTRINNEFGALRDLALESFSENVR